MRQRISIKGYVCPLVHWSVSLWLRNPFSILNQQNRRKMVKKDSTFLQSFSYNLLLSICLSISLCLSFFHILSITIFFFKILFSKISFTVFLTTFLLESFFNNYSFTIFISQWFFHNLYFQPLFFNLFKLLDKLLSAYGIV